MTTDSTENVDNEYVLTAIIPIRENNAITPKTQKTP